MQKKRTGNIHGFLIDAAARIVTIDNKDIDRLSLEERENYAKKYDLIKGKDTMGRNQYVLLNKEVIREVGKDNIAPPSITEQE